MTKDDIPEVEMTPYEFAAWARANGMDEKTIELLCKPMGVDVPPFLFGEEKKNRRMIILKDRRGKLEFRK